MTDLCKCCGRCCYLPDGKPCPFLLKTDVDGVYVCAVYDHRFSAMRRRGMICHLRKNSDVDYEDCPYNTDKPIRKTH